jgi:transaldolase / glucose-6-phosphate isomerase
MAIPAQSIVAGCLQSAFHRELEYFLENRVLERLWAKDATLWPEEEFEQSHIRSNLGWLDLPGSLEPFLKAVKQEESAATADGLNCRALIAFEAANLAARALLPFVQSANDDRRVILDSTCPTTIYRAEKRLNLERTLFIFTSKAGYRLEGQALFLYFMEKLQSLGVPQPPQHFVAETEPGSYLATLGREYNLRATFADPSGILAPFTSLRHLGALLVSQLAQEPEGIVAAAKEMHHACSCDAIPAENSALQLAAFLSGAAVAKRRYVAFLATPSLVPYTYCLGQLIGGSLAKQGPGLIPIDGEVPRDTRGLEQKAAFAILTYAGDTDPELYDLMSRFRFSGVPFVHVRIAEPLGLLPATFGWEVATVMACARLGFDPFDGSDARLPRTLAMEYLNKYSPANDTLSRRPRLQDRGLQLFAEGKTRREISTLNLEESLGSFFQLLQPESFLAVLVFLPQTRRVLAAFQALRKKLAEKLAIPVLLAHGPHSLHHYSHLHRKGLPHGQFLVITAEPASDLAIPGASYTFGQLYRALALGEFEGLVQSDRFVVRVHLTGDIPVALENLGHVVSQALARKQ